MTRHISRMLVLGLAWAASPAWANPEGKVFFERACAACHAVSSDEPKKSGPLLRGIVGRSSGKVEGYVYSAALNKAGLVWDAKTLDRWLEDPSALVPGNNMGYAMRNPERRALVIDYLTTLK
ncbi:MAG: hypothetical protein RJA77_838 [Pseudomonadota bacterium]